MGDRSLTPGGIDLDTANLNLLITMSTDQAQLAESHFQKFSIEDINLGRNHISRVEPLIIQITPFSVKQFPFLQK